MILNEHKSNLNILKLGEHKSNLNILKLGEHKSNLNILKLREHKSEPNLRMNILKLRDDTDINKLDWCIYAFKFNPIYYLSINSYAINSLENNLDKIDWLYLSKNPNAIHILQKHIDKIYWHKLTFNSCIFTYDYKQIKENKKKLHEELISVVFHPSRISYYLSIGYDIDNL
jgi:hypothetical protein